MSRFLPQILFVFLAASLAGCMTAKISPTGVENLAAITGAPAVVLGVKDARTKDAIGKIALQTVKVKRSDFEKLTSDKFSQYLYGQNLNAAQSKDLNLGSSETIQKAISNAGAIGSIFVQIDSLHVESIDIMLDEPDYELAGTVTIHDRSGNLLFNGNINQKMGSRAMYWKAKGDTIEQLLQMSMLDLENDPKFQAAVKTLQNSQ